MFAVERRAIFQQGIPFYQLARGNQCQTKSGHESKRFCKDPIKNFRLGASK
jgi:hypothetical protein